MSAAKGTDVNAMDGSTAAAALCGHSQFRNVAQYFVTQKVARGLWNLDREAPSLGGLLLLRSELELWTRACGLTRIALSMLGSRARDAGAFSSLAAEILRSAFPCAIEPYDDSNQYWPPAAEQSSKNFSYQFFDRCTELYAISGLKPTLSWDQGTLHKGRDARRAFTGRLYTAHLKQVPGAGAEQSNANMESWSDFLRSAARVGESEFLLLGKDPVPSEIAGVPGVHVADRIGLPLAVQLALIPMSNGFLGMASGVCAAAILSEVPYAVFKHPRHHVEEMRRQIGTGDALAFASRAQKILRSEDSTSVLYRALELLRSADA